MGKTKRKGLDVEDTATAKALHEEWFKQYPKQKNPSDMNTEEKYHFAIRVGWVKYKMMQTARKGNVARTGYKYPWTKIGYWNEIWGLTN